MIHLARSYLIAPGDNERNVRPKVGRLSFPAPPFVAVSGLRKDARGCTVVGRENEDGIVPHTAVLEVLHHSAHLLVEVADHGLKISGIGACGKPRLVAVVPQGVVGSSGMGRVHQRFGIIEKERLALINLTVDIVEGIVLHGVGAVNRKVVALAIVVPHAVGIPVGLTLPSALEIHLHLAAERLLEACERNHGAAPAKLPLTHYGGTVPALAGKLREGVLVLIHIAERHIVTVVVKARHDLHPRGRTERLGVHIAVHQTHTRQRIDTRRLILHSAIAAEALGAYVIGKEKNNVGFGRTRMRAARNGCSGPKPESDF